MPGVPPDYSLWPCDTEQLGLPGLLVKVAAIRPSPLQQIPTINQCLKALESSQKQVTREGSQYLENRNGIWVSFPYVWGSTVDGRLQRLPRGATKIQRETPKSYWLKELEDRVWSDSSNWKVRVGIPEKKAPERGGSNSVYKLSPNLRPTFEMSTQGLL